MDTREKLEADVRQWLQSRLIGNEVFETVISWLARQAAITEREWKEQCAADECCGFQELVDINTQVQAKVDELTEERDRLRGQLDDFDGDCYCGATVTEWYEHSKRLKAKADELTNERDELLRKSNEFEQTIAELNGAVCERDVRIGAYEHRNTELNDALKAICNRYGVGTKWAAEDAVKNVFETIDSTHMLLPVDADGVPIRPGDELVYRGTEPFMCYAVSEKHAHTWDAAANAIGHLACKCRHVQPETVEGILAEAMSFACEPEAPFSENSKYVKQYAERIRKAVGNA